MGTKRTEEGLARSHAELEALYDSAPILLCSLDEQMRILRANRAFAQLAAQAESDILGSPDCALRLAIEDTCRTGRAHRDVEHWTTLGTGSSRREAVFLASTVRIVAADRPMILLCMQDITARVRAEEALRASEGRLKMAAEASSDGIWDWPDLSVPRFWWSPRFCALIGYGPDELDPSTETFMDLLHPDDRGRVREEMSLRVVSTEPFESEYRLLDKSGGYRWFLARGVVHGDGRGKPGRMTGSIRDITDRKCAEEKLRQSEHAYKTLIENTPDIIARFDRSLRHVFVSSSVANVTGRAAAEFIGKTNAEMGMPADTLAFWDRRLGDAFATGQMQSIEFDFQGPAGVRHFSSLLVPERTGDGSVISVLSVARDVTEAREAQKRLAAEEERHRLLLDTLQEGVLTLDPHGRIVFVNRRLAGMLGSSAHEMMGRPFASLFAPGAGGSADELLSRWIAEPGVGREAAFLRADGSPVDVEIRAGLLLGADRKPSGFIASVLDTTDRKNTERELHKSHGKLRSLARHLLRAREEERRKIAQEIHDELGQVLTGLSMDVRWLARRLERAPQKVRDKVQGVIDLADHTIRMVQRISSELRPRMLDDLGLGAALEWLAGDFSRRMGVSCSVEVTAAESRIGGNTATALFRIVQEALTNVARHAQANKVTVRLWETPQRLELSIGDNGIGISEEAAAGPQSFGLIGLRERVEELGGEISIKGERGTGTAISVSIPFPQGGTLA